MNKGSINMEKAFRCQSCKEVFLAVTWKQHDSTPCPFCAAEAIEILDAIGLEGLKYIVTDALNDKRKREVKGLESTLNITLETGLSKSVETEACLKRIGALDSALLWVGRL